MTNELWVPPYEYSTAGGGWGMHVEWSDYKTGRVWGHHPRIPKVGDLLRSNLVSGRVGIFRFTDVERKLDPPDMFFGTVEPVGYEDELDMPSLFAEPLPQPDSPTMNLLHPERLGFFEGIRSLFRRFK